MSNLVKTHDHDALLAALREPMINEAAVPGVDFADQLAQLGATLRQYGWKNTAAALEAKAAQIRAALDVKEGK